MAANTLAPCIARSSAAMILTMQDKWALVIYKDKFQLPVPYYDWEMLVTDCRYIFMFPKVNLWWQGLTHWGQVTQICVSNLTIINSDNGLSPHRRQAIIWTDAGILLIPPLGTKFSEILIKIHTFSFKKMHLKTLSAKWRPFCVDFNVLTLNVRGPSYFGLSRSISWLLMPWLLSLPGHQHPWYWQCRIGRFLSYLRKDPNFQNDTKCKYMFTFPLKNLARKGLRESP